MQIYLSKFSAYSQRPILQNFFNFNELLLFFGIALQISISIPFSGNHLAKIERPCRKWAKIRNGYI